MDELSKKAFENWAREEDKKVFVDYTNPRVKTNETLYGEGISRSGSPLYSTKDRITHLGFNNISDFDIAIRKVKADIKDYNILLEELQDRIDEIDVTLKNKNPEHDITGVIPRLNAELEEHLEKSKSIIVKLEKEQKNLKELEAARKEFLSNKKSTFKNKTNDRLGTLDELSRAEKELKDLDVKIYAGTANDFERERYEVLKNEIIPELNEILNSQKIKPNVPDSSEVSDEPEVVQEESVSPEEEEDEIVNEEDGSHLINDSKFKRFWKKALKIGAVVGAVGLVAGAIYMFTKGDSEPLTNMVQGAADTMQGAADAAQEAVNNAILDSASVGDVSTVFDSNMEAMQGVNPETPIDAYFQSDALGYVTDNNQMVEVNSLGEIVDAHNNGVDVNSIYVGNEQGIDGFVNEVHGQPLDQFLESYGGKSR